MYLSYTVNCCSSHLRYFEARVVVDVDVRHRPLVTDCNQLSSRVHREATNPSTIQTEDDPPLHGGYLKDHQGIASSIHHLARLDVLKIVRSCRVQPEGMVRGDVVPR